MSSIKVLLFKSIVTVSLSCTLSDVAQGFRPRKRLNKPNIRNNSSNTVNTEAPNRQRLVSLDSLLHPSTNDDTAKKKFSLVDILGRYISPVPAFPGPDANNYTNGNGSSESDASLTSSSVTDTTTYYDYHNNLIVPPLPIGLVSLTTPSPLLPVGPVGLIKTQPLPVDPVLTQPKPVGPVSLISTQPKPVGLVQSTHQRPGPPLYTTANPFLSQALFPPPPGLEISGQQDSSTVTRSHSATPLRLDNLIANDNVDEFNLKSEKEKKLETLVSELNGIERDIAELENKRAKVQEKIDELKKIEREKTDREARAWNMNIKLVDNFSDSIAKKTNGRQSIQRKIEKLQN